MKPEKKLARGEIIREELLKIERSGPLTPERIVAAATPKSHPLHDCFEWDDIKAGDAFRLWQARKLVATYLIEYVGGETLRTTCSVFKDDVRQYVPVLRVMSEDELRKQALDYILIQIAHWKRQWKHCHDVLDVIEKTVRKAKRKK